MLGIAASLSFLLMMFNVPVPGGTTAHAVGGTLLAILIGPLCSLSGADSRLTATGLLIWGWRYSRSWGQYFQHGHCDAFRWLCYL